MKVSRSATLAVGVACWLAAELLLLNFVYADESPKKEICLEATLECGGQGTIPGPMSQCSKEQKGKDCDYCDGTDKYRLCQPNNQNYHCTFPETKPKCGSPQKGTCTEYGIEGLITIYYCKDNGKGKGTDDCTVPNSCTGVEAN